MAEDRLKVTVALESQFHTRDGTGEVTVEVQTDGNGKLSDESVRFLQAAVTVAAIQAKDAYEEDARPVYSYLWDRE